MAPRPEVQVAQYEADEAHLYLGSDILEQAAIVDSSAREGLVCMGRSVAPASADGTRDLNKADQGRVIIHDRA